jgi:hypothetical protein
MSYPPYNDLLFEIYHYIPKSNIQLLNKSSKRLRIIDGRIKRYVYHKQYKQFDDPDEGLYKGCKTGDMNLVLQMIERGADNWNSGLEYACRGKGISMPNCPLDLGNMQIVKLMIKKGANNWDSGLANACQSGHMKIVELMIKKGANNWNWGLENACEGGNMKIIKLMIKRGANDWDWGLRGACQGGNMKIIKFMIKKGANDWDYGLYGACQGKGISMPNCPLDLGHMKIVKLMIKRGATQCYCNRSMQEHYLKND